MRCCGTQDLNGGRPASSSTPGTLVGLSREIDWSAQGNVTLTDGAHVIVDTLGNPISHTAGSAAGASTWRLRQGFGMEFAANASSTVFTSASQTGTHLWASLAAYFAAWGVDPTWVMTVRHYFSVITIPTNASRVQVGLWGIAGVPLSLASARVRSVAKSRTGGVFSANFGIDTAYGANRTGAGVDASNVLGYIAAPGTTSGLWGVFNGSWADSVITEEIAMDSTTTNNPNTFRDGSVRAVIAFPTNTAAGDQAATLQRTRFDFAPLLAAA